MGSKCSQETWVQLLNMDENICIFFVSEQEAEIHSYAIYFKELCNNLFFSGREFTGPLIHVSLKATAVNPGHLKELQIPNSTTDYDFLDKVCSFNGKEQHNLFGPFQTAVANEVVKREELRSVEMEMLAVG